MLCETTEESARVLQTADVDTASVQVCHHPPVRRCREEKKKNTPCVVQATHLRNVVVESVGGTGRGALRSEHWEGNPRCKIGKQHRSLWPQVSHYWYQGMGALLGNAPSHTHCINAPSHCHDKHYP